MYIVEKPAIKNDLNCVPNPVLSHILGYVGYIGVKKVCKMWNQTKFMIHEMNTYKMSFEHIRNIRGILKSLKGMSVVRMKFAYDYVLGIEDAELLRDINVFGLCFGDCRNYCENHGNVDNMLRVMREIKCLRNLEIHGCSDVNDSVMKMMCEEPSIGNLRSVVLSGVKVTDVGISYLAICRGLEELRIEFCGGVRGKTLGMLSGLRTLTIYYCNNVEVGEVICMVGMDLSLRSLNVAHCGGWDGLRTKWVNSLNGMIDDCSIDIDNCSIDIDNCSIDIDDRSIDVKSWLNKNFEGRRLEIRSCMVHVW